MLPCLDRKLFRDLNRLCGQALAVALVMACGLAMMIMARSLIRSLETARDDYYQDHRFAQVFAHLKRAPHSVADQAARIPGVARAQADISVQVTLDIAGLDEPASGTVRSLPAFGQPELNRLFLRAGRWLSPGRHGEVLVGEAFADANRIRPDDSIVMVLHGRREVLRVAGIVLSPEFIFESRPGTPLPDSRAYGSFWLPYADLAAAFSLDGAFNYMVLALEPGASERAVIAELDRLLKPYGGRGAFGRAEHPSHIRVLDEIRVLATMAVAFPIVFLGVAAFMTNAILSRLVDLQREQIAILKAFGFSNRQVAAHYLKFALVIVAGGTLTGAIGGALLGQWLVGLYHDFFRFPELTFRLDRPALLAALVVSAAAAVTGVFGAVRRAARLPPAEAMRPQPPASYRPAWIERSGVARHLSTTFRIAMRNLERRPMRALFTCAGLSLATGILIVPNCFRDAVAEVLDYQWHVVQRQDMSAGLIEPASLAARHPLRQLPGAVSVEPVRSVAVRLRFGHRHRQLVLRGLPAKGLHDRIINPDYQTIILPPQGLVLSAKLAQILGAKVGDQIIVEVLDERRPVRSVPLARLAEDFAGLAAYMERSALNRMLGEGDVINGATFRVDPGHRAAFLHALKETPRVNWVAIKDSMRANFRQTTAASINTFQTIYLVFATVVAFGVVYNNVRISLAERARELATLRVIGFSRREVGGVLVAELVMLALVAVPFGLLLGSGFAAGIVRAINTETVRLPVVLTMGNFGFAVLVVSVASTLSAIFVLRQLHRLDLVGALKAPE